MGAGRDFMLSLPDGIRRGLELEPSFRIRLFFEYGLAPALAERLVEGARVLGLPESLPRGMVGIVVQALPKVGRPDE